MSSGIENQHVKIAYLENYPKIKYPLVKLNVVKMECF